MPWLLSCHKTINHRVDGVINPGQGKDDQHGLARPEPQRLGGIMVSQEVQREGRADAGEDDQIDAWPITPDYSMRLTTTSEHRGHQPTPTPAHNEYQAQEYNLEGGKAQPGQRQTPRYRLRSAGSMHQGVAWHQKDKRRQAPYGDG